MAKTSKKQTLVIQGLIKEIETGQHSKIVSALKSLQVNGDATVLEPLADVMLTKISLESAQLILEFFSNLKMSDTIDVFMDIVKDEKYLKIRQLLLSTIWQSKLDYSDYLADFVEIACEGDFMEAMECLTIIENLEGPFKETQILESQLHLKEYLEDNSPKDQKKSHVLSEIAVFIKDFNEMDFDDIEMLN